MASTLQTTSANDLVVGALRRIGKYAAGQPLDSNDADDAIMLMNDMLDGWSNNNLLCVASLENVFPFINGKAMYTVGNPVSDNSPPCTTTLNSAVLTAVIPFPPDIAIGADLSNVGATIQKGATCIAFSSAANTITMSLPATANLSNSPLTFTIPGDFKMDRPIHVNEAFTRITSNSQALDYGMDIISEDQYTRIGYKGVPGPWPTALYPNPTFPYASWYFYPVPAGASELHVWCDQVLVNFTSATQKIKLPQGYAKLIKLGLALELWPEYHKNADVPTWLNAQFMNIKSQIETVNQRPQAIATYDTRLPRAQTNDAGWIYDGGFNRG